MGIATTASAQISERGTPPSFRYQTTLRSKEAVTDIPVTFSVEDMKQVDRWQESEGLEEFLGRLAEKIATEARDLGEVNPLIDEQITERFLGRDRDRKSVV